MQTMEVTHVEDLASTLVKDATKKAPLSASDEKQTIQRLHELLRPGEVFEYALQSWPGLLGLFTSAPSDYFMVCSNKRVAFVGGIELVGIPFRDMESVELQTQTKLVLHLKNGKNYEFTGNDRLRVENMCELIKDHLAAG